MKIGEGSEVYGFVVEDDGEIVFLSEKVALEALEGAMSTFAEATFAAALAFIAISEF